MHVAVFGATGNVGTSVVDALAGDTEVTEVTGIARRLRDFAPAKTRSVAADIARDDLMPYLRGVEAVVHLAWLFQPTHSPMVTWRTNVEGSLRVFDAVAQAGVRTLVYASSVGAYSPGEGDRMVDETWPTHSVPTAAYGREKAYVERALDAFEARHPEIRVVRLRPGFIFKRAAATSQRRLFLGPLVPGILARPGVLPVVTYPAGLRFQALHSDDAAEAYRLAVMTDVRGPFNIASDPVIDGPVLADILGARGIAVPRKAVRTAVATGWHLRLVPADPALLDLFLSLPLLDTTRARTELGWKPRISGPDALREMLQGMSEGAGGPTPPLAADSPRRRGRELLTGVGQRP